MNMNVNKKLDRLKQWAGERMGGEAKTNVSEDFKALETEMNLRYEGMDKMHRSMTAYVKAISKRTEGDDREKTLPIAHLGSVMIQHGDDFDSQSDFGRSLTLTGRAHERLARLQDSFSVQASSSWLEALERSLASMKEYQNARKKLESRRLAYDASLAKMQKAKKEDFRVEEELRTQKVKYEETNDDVYRRMMDIQDAEGENLTDLTAFIDAELNYHERCREVLFQLRNELPKAHSPAPSGNSRRAGRARSNTAHSYQERYEPVQEELHPSPPRPTIRSTRSPSSHRPQDDVSRGRTDSTYLRPTVHRTSTFEGPTQLRNDDLSAPQRAQSDLAIRTTKTSLRPVSKIYEDYHDSASHGNVSPYDDRSETSGTSPGGYFSRTPSSSTLNATTPGAKKGPPPPPPSRATKPRPPPPPPPAKRNLIGA